MTDQRTQNMQPIWQKPLDPAIHLRVYRNGDDKFPGKVVTLNKCRQKTFESWLGDLSNSMKLRSGAVWRVFTPTQGHRVDSLDTLEEGQLIVVAGQERFKKLGYAQIDPNPKRGLPKTYDVEPGANRRYNVSGRYRKIDAHGKIIKCWPNGDDSCGPRTVLLSYRQPFTLESILEQVSGVLKDDVCGPVEKLYLPNGIKVMSLDQILPNAHYVALRRQDIFKKAHYREVSLPNFRTSPRLERKNVLPPLSRSNKTSSQSSPEHSYSSNNGYRRDKARREEDQVFHAKPVKHRRSSEKTRQADYDQDQGGVFKAKNQNQATRGARQVEDTRQTRTELPVDRRPTEEVQEEKGKGKDEKEAKKNKKDEPQQQRTYRANSKRPTPPGGDQINEENEREARARREAEDRERAERARQQRAAVTQKKKEEEERSKQEEEEEERRKEREREEARKKQQQQQGKGQQQQQQQQGKGQQQQQQQQGKGQQQQQQGKGKTTSTPEASKNKARNDDKNNQRQSPTPQASPINDNHQEELAAAKIQAGYRGYKTRKDLQEQQAEREVDKKQRRAEDDLAAHNRQLEMEEEEKAAAKIQAGFRGHKTRQELKAQRAEQDRYQDRQDSDLLREDPIPLHGDDEDWGPGPDHNTEREHQAATTIQAGFRGYQDRQKVKEMRARQG